jgi:hypothetical protein
MAVEARYTNVFDVGFDAFEFVIDCSLSAPGGEAPAPHARIITTPAFARVLARMLHHSVEQYEQRFGPIPGDAGASNAAGDEETS